METSLTKVINEVAKGDIIKTFFPAAFNKTYEWNGIVHQHLGSGSCRDVYVDPEFNYVLKVTKTEQGASFNAFEYFHYLRNKSALIVLNLVPTRLIDLSPTVVQQDFLLVFNTRRVVINPILEDHFQPDRQNPLTEAIGYQYGWNPKSKRVEIYDYADFLLHNGWDEFENYYDWETKKFTDLEFEKIFAYRNEFNLTAKELGVFEDIDYCHLKHQEGIILDYKTNEVSASEEFHDVVRPFGAKGYNVDLRKLEEA